MSSDKAAPSAGKRRIKINRGSFQSASNNTPASRQVSNDDSVSPPAKLAKLTGKAEEVQAVPEIRSIRVTKSEAQEAQSKIVDDLFKDFLVQKMAVIEKEREQMKSSEDTEGTPDRGKSLEKERQDMNEIIQDPTPFKEFLIQKMALIEQERVQVEQAKDRNKKTEPSHKKVSSKRSSEEGRGSKKESKAEKNSRKRSSKEERSSEKKSSKEERDSEKRSPKEIKSSKEEIVSDKTTSKVDKSSENRSTKEENSTKDVKLSRKESKEERCSEKPPNDNKLLEKKVVKDDKPAEKKRLEEEIKKEQNKAEALAQKIAAIEKERKEAERKAIQSAEEGNKKDKKHKSHKKDKKKDKEKKRDRHRSRSYSRSKSRSRSGSRSRDRSKERKKKHKNKHKERDKTEDSDKEKRSRSHSHRSHRSGSREKQKTVTLDKNKGSASDNPSLLTGTEWDKKKNSNPEKNKVSESGVQRKIFTENNSFKVTIQTSSDSQTDIKPAVNLKQEESSTTEPVPSVHTQPTAPKPSLEHSKDLDGFIERSKMAVKTEESQPKVDEVQKAETGDGVVKSEPGAMDKAGAEGEAKGAKKAGPIKIGIKISQTSAELIQSGRRLDLEGKTSHLEEGKYRHPFAAIVALLFIRIVNMHKYSNRTRR